MCHRTLLQLYCPKNKDELWIQSLQIGWVRYTVVLRVKVRALMRFMGGDRRVPFKSQGGWLDTFDTYQTLCHFIWCLKSLGAFSAQTNKSWYRSLKCHAADSPRSSSPEHYQEQISFFTLGTAQASKKEKKGKLFSPTLAGQSSVSQYRIILLTCSLLWGSDERHDMTTDCVYKKTLPLSRNREIPWCWKCCIEIKRLHRGADCQQSPQGVKLPECNPELY